MEIRPGWRLPQFNLVGALISSRWQGTDKGDLTEELNYIVQRSDRSNHGA